MSLGIKIQKLRKKNNMSQEKLAESLNVSRQSVSKWELEQSVPELDKIIQMSNLFSISTDYLLKDVEQQNSNNLTNEVQSEEKANKIQRITVPKICGICILVVSLITLIIAIVLQNDTSETLIVIAILLFIISLICLFIEKLGWKPIAWTIWGITALFLFSYVAFAAISPYGLIHYGIQSPMDIVQLVQILSLIVLIVLTIRSKKRKKK